MKKLLVMFLLSFVCASTSYAAACDSSKGNKYFWGATMSKNQVGCTYRYCYYTCEYDYYTIEGKFKPVGTKWKQKSEHRYECIAAHEGDSNDCSFK